MLVHRVTGAILVAQLPCHSKRCAACWLVYRRRLVRRLVQVFDQPGMSVWCLFLISNSTQRTRLETVTKGLRRAGADWTVIPLKKDRAVVISTAPGLGFEPVRDLERFLTQVMRRHEKSQRVTSSRSIKVTARQPAQWTIWGSARTVEGAAQWLTDNGVMITWKGINCFEVGTTEETLRKLERTLAQA